jgi:hypothetical protein
MTHEVNHVCKWTETELHILRRSISLGAEVASKELRFAGYDRSPSQCYSKAQKMGWFYVGRLKVADLPEKTGGPTPYRQAWKPLQLVQPAPRRPGADDASKLPSLNARKTP